MSDSAEVTVRTEIDGAVATVVLDRPGARNALDVPTKLALRAALEAAADDDAVRAVVLRGEGKAFCVGQDLAEHVAALGEDASTALDTVGEHYNPVLRAITTMPKPVVAAVHGACVGAGLGIALACDLQVWADDATLATAFTGIGLTFDSGLSHTLARAVGDARARELILLGTAFDPATGVGWGLSGEVVPAAEVAGSAHGLATRLAAGPTLAYAASKRLLAASASSTLLEALAAEADEQSALGATADHTAAVEAFLAKEKPVFRGR